MPKKQKTKMFNQKTAEDLLYFGEVSHERKRVKKDHSMIAQNNLCVAILTGETFRKMTKGVKSFDELLIFTRELQRFGYLSYLDWS